MATLIRPLRISPCCRTRITGDVAQGGRGGAESFRVFAFMRVLNASVAQAIGQQFTSRPPPAARSRPRRRPRPAARTATETPLGTGWPGPCWTPSRRRPPRGPLAARPIPPAETTRRTPRWRCGWATAASAAAARPALSRCPTQRLRPAAAARAKGPALARLGRSNRHVQLMSGKEGGCQSRMPAGVGPPGLSVKQKECGRKEERCGQ